MIDFCLLNGAKLYEEDISYVEEIIYLLRDIASNITFGRPS